MNPILWALHEHVILVGLGCLFFGAFVGAVIMGLCASVKEPPAARLMVDGGTLGPDLDLATFRRLIREAFPRAGVYNQEGIAQEITRLMREAGRNTVCQYNHSANRFYITSQAAAQLQRADATR